MVVTANQCLTDKPCGLAQRYAFLAGLSVYLPEKMPLPTLTVTASQTKATLKVVAYRFTDDCGIEFVSKQQKRKRIAAHDIDTLITLLPALPVADAYLVGCHCGWSLQ